MERKARVVGGRADARRLTHPLPSFCECQDRQQPGREAFGKNSAAESMFGLVCKDSLTSLLVFNKHISESLLGIKCKI